MKKIVVIIFAVVALGVEAVFAQNISPMELKNARLAVYEWFDEYETNPLKEKRSPRMKFYSLFLDTSVNIVNDFLYIDNYDFNNPLISVGSYCDMYFAMRGSFYNKSRNFVNKKLVSEQLYDDCVKYEIDFDELLSIVDTTILNNRYAYPDMLLNCRVRIDYNLKTKQAKAASIVIRGKIDEFVVLHQDVEPYNEYTTEKQLKSDSASLSNNNVPMINYEYKSCDFDSKMYELRCDTMKWSVFLGGSVGNGFWGTISNNLYSDMDPRSKLNYSIGFGAYRQIILKGSDRLGLEFGLSYRQTKLNINNIYGDRYASVDADGGSYERIIAVTDYEEDLTRFAAGLPVALRYDHFMMAGQRKRFAFSAKFGVLPMYDFKQVSRATADAQYSGYYDWLWGITIDQNDIYDFGNYAIDNKYETTAVDRFSLDVVGALGLSYYVNPRVSVDLSAAYYGTIYNKVNNTDDYCLTRDMNDWHSATFLMKRYSLHSINFMLQMNYNF